MAARPFSRRFRGKRCASPKHGCVPTMLPNMIADRIAKAIGALRAAGHPVEVIPDCTDRYRVDGRDPVTGRQVLVLALHLGLLDAPGRRQ
jgi:hypothetical protein